MWSFKCSFRCSIRDIHFFKPQDRFPQVRGRVAKLNFTTLNPAKPCHVTCSGSRKRNENSWTALILQHTKLGQGRFALKLYEEMRKDGVRPSTYTVVPILKACSTLQDLESAKQIHADVVAHGFDSNLYVGNVLVDTYAKCGSLVDSRHMFENMPCRNVVTWTAMITAYVQMDRGEEALQLYTQMQREGVVPNDRTYVSALKACSSMAESGVKNERCLDTVRCIHADISRAQCNPDVFLRTMLVDVYAKCGSLEEARCLFEKIPDRTVVSWTAMILGYAIMGNGEEALQLYARMQQEGVVPNDRTYVSVLKACSALAEWNEGEGIASRKGYLETVKTIHTDVMKGKFDSDLYVGNVLVDVYAKFQSLEDARRVFESMPIRDVVSWNAMIFGYAQVDKGEEALNLYTWMQREGVIPDSRTYVGVLNACGSLARLEKGKEIHAQICKAGLDASDLFLASSLIDMYGKCGSMVDAQQVFDAMCTREVVAWNALIAGYAHQGESEIVLDLFDRMKQAGIRPNGITFLGLLNVCSHVGLVDTGQKHFETMSRDYDITPTIHHFSCIVDILGRAGHLEKAMVMVKTMPVQPNIGVWRCMLGACQKWGDVELGRQAFECAMVVNKDDAAAYVLMSNIYAAAHMRKEVTEIQAMRKQSRAWKQPGQSQWVDLNGIAHMFVVGDQGHPESQDIYSKLGDLLVKMKKHGYVPHLQSVLRDIPDDEKEHALCGHSEKLAIAYAILKTPEGTNIRVVKNLRVCEDCHRATAVISMIEKRTIICRDASRFHVFKDGKCSCGDYW